MKNSAMDNVMLQFCKSSTPADANKLLLAFAFAFLVSFFCLPLLHVVMMFVAGLVGLGIRGLAGSAAHVVDRDMAKANGLAKVNLAMSSGQKSRIDIYFLVALATGFVVALVACAAQAAKLGITHLSLTPRLSITPVVSFA